MPGKPFMKCKNKKTNCFANKSDACRILTDTTFKDENGEKIDCPFYKSQEQHQEESKKYEV